jgi:hypothetical protein
MKSVLAALAPAISRFRFEVQSVAETAKGLLHAEANTTPKGSFLGAFAGGRIDPARFEMISAGADPLDAASKKMLGRMLTSLEELTALKDEDFVLSVAPGENFGDAVRARLATLGSLFAMSTLVELIRRRSYDAATHGTYFAAMPFERWTAAQRKVALPLVVAVSGADLDEFAIGPLLDGCVRFVLLVDEPCAAAPLARLISPGVFVAQADDATACERARDLEAPAVIAIMSGNEARFIHDPRNGTAPWQRLQVTKLTETPPRKSVGARSVWRQRDDLAHLKSLAEQPSLPAEPADALVAAIGGEMTDPAERLTSWLVEQSHVSPPAA